MVGNVDLKCGSVEVSVNFMGFQNHATEVSVRHTKTRSTSGCGNMWKMWKPADRFVFFETVKTGCVQTSQTPTDFSAVSGAAKV